MPIGTGEEGQGFSPWQVAVSVRQLQSTSSDALLQRMARTQQLYGSASGHNNPAHNIMLREFAGMAQVMEASFRALSATQIKQLPCASWEFMNPLDITPTISFPTDRAVLSRLLEHLAVSKCIAAVARSMGGTQSGPPTEAETLTALRSSPPADSCTSAPATECAQGVLDSNGMLSAVNHLTARVDAQDSKLIELQDAAAQTQQGLDTVNSRIEAIHERLDAVVSTVASGHPDQDTVGQLQELRTNVEVLRQTVQSIQRLSISLPAHLSQGAATKRSRR